MNKDVHCSRICNEGKGKLPRSPVGTDGGSPQESPVLLYAWYSWSWEALRTRTSTGLNDQWRSGLPLQMSHLRLGYERLPLPSWALSLLTLGKQLSHPGDTQTAYGEAHGPGVSHYKQPGTEACDGHRSEPG